MRILQISSARYFGGGERHLVDLVSGFRRSRHEVFVAVTHDSPLLAEFESIPDEKVLRFSFRNPFDLASAWKLRRFARERKIEIVHAHRARDYPLAALVAGNSGPRLVLSRHVLFPMGKIHKLTRRRVARLIAVSEAVAASLRAQRIFHEDQITVVRHGIDLSRFPSGRQANESDKLRIGILGELSPVKGQADFVRAAAIVTSQRKDVEFVIAGRDNSDEGKYSHDLKQLIAASGLSGAIALIETKIDVARFLSQLDVFVSASHSEAFGLAIVEAMASGVPVVATATDGAREIITDGLTGRLVPIANASELANRIVELLNDGEGSDVLSANARKMVAEKFSLARMIAETEDVYRAILTK